MPPKPRNHQLARVIFHGRWGELRQLYREGQDDQLGALGLTVKLVVLWHSIDMDAALNQLVSEGYEVRSEDDARLFPLGLKHYVVRIGHGLMCIRGNRPLPSETVR